METGIGEVPFLARDGIEHMKTPRQEGRRLHHETHQDS